VLNAKEHERESEIIKDAGQPARSRSRRTWPAAASTSSSAKGVVDLGGLYVLATERHESRRIDNQLRGRSGRQGDPGETRFYLSGEDDLVASSPATGSRTSWSASSSGRPAHGGEDPLEPDRERAEEGRGAELRRAKNVLKYDDVMNTQRQVIYEQRRPRARRRRPLRGRARVDPRERRGGVMNATEVSSPRTGISGARHPDAVALRHRHHRGGAREEVELEREALIEEFVDDAIETYNEKERSTARS
jgi:preprotein translocase subunit SecA